MTQMRLGLVSLVFVFYLQTHDVLFIYCEPVFYYTFLRRQNIELLFL